MSSDWQEVRLEDVTSRIGDGLHGTPNYDDDGEYYFINGNNLSNGRIVIDEKTKRASKEEYLKHKKDINDRTILVSINGTIGNVALYEGENVFLGKSACYLNVLDSVDKQYVRYVICSNHFQDYISSLATGSTIKNVSLKLVRNFTFRLPPLSVQKTISKVLSDLDNKIELNRQINQTLEQMAQTIFKSWFVDFDPVRAKMEGRDTGLPAPIVDLFPDELVESELGLVPKGWGWSTIGDEFDVTMGQSPPGDTYNENGEGVCFFQGRTDFGWRYPVNRIYCTAPARMAKKGDTLLSVRAPVGDVNKAVSDCCIGRGLCAIRHKSGCEAYTYYVLKNLAASFVSFNSEGTVFGSINQKDLKSLRVVSPSGRLLMAYSNAVAAIDEKIRTHEDEIVSLASIRDSLLPKLVSGAIEVGEAS